MSHKSYEIPCELCLGSGKRKMYELDSQPTLPISILLKAEQVFGDTKVSLSCDNGFNLCSDVKGTYEEILAKRKEFHRWLFDNYPDEISHDIVLSIKRFELPDELKESKKDGK